MTDWLLLLGGPNLLSLVCHALRHQLLQPGVALADLQPDIARRLLVWRRGNHIIVMADPFKYYILSSIPS